MVGFKVLKTIGEIELKKFPISSQTVLVGDLFELVTGATTWTACTATSKHFYRKAIAYEAASTSATEFLGYEVTGLETVEVQCANTASANDNGDLMILTDKNTVNNTHSNVTTEEPVFIQDKIGSTTTSIIGRIIVGNGVDPDLTG